MPSPFPGMDPFLEDHRLWPAFQRALIHSLIESHTLLNDPTSRYECRIGNRLYTVEEPQPETNPSGEQREAFIEIRNRADGHLITLIEVVSPANKRTTSGQKAYRDMRLETIAQKASIVELDLLLQGQPTLIYSRDGLPEFDYAVSVTKSTAPDRYEIYTATIQKRLPKFRLPLAPGDKDALFDLQAVFMQSYDHSGIAKSIDYRRDPDVQMSEENRRFLTELRQSGLLPQLAIAHRPASFHKDIAVAAYFLWLQAGRPHGRDQDHWYQAIEQLMTQVEMR